MTSITIQLPQTVYQIILQLAHQQKLPPDRFVSDYLQRQLLPHSSSLIGPVDTDIDEYPTLEEVVSEIKATPPNTLAVHPAKESLLMYLSNLPTDDDTSFSALEWNHAWANFEAELKAIDLANDIAEGHI